MTAGGLLWRGSVVPVPGVTVQNPRTAAWARLSPGDYAPRRTRWIRQIVPHTTKGIWPHLLVPGAGSRLGSARSIADFWSRDPEHSAAQVVVGADGEVGCLCDLATVAAYHATTSNDWSVGLEMFQASDGGVTEATYRATVAVVLVLAELCEIPLQLAGHAYKNTIVRRLRDGGPDVVGIVGHRDQAWREPRYLTPEQRRRYPDGYAARGRGDPGDEIYRRLVAAGAEPFDYDAREDVAAWVPRQRFLNLTYKAGLKEDGIAGPATFRAMRARGFLRGRDIPA